MSVKPIAASVYVLSSAVLLIAGQATAEPIKLSTSVTTEYSDNVTKRADGEGDTVIRGSVRASYRNQSGIFENDFSGALGLETYLSSVFENDTTIDLSWLSLINIIPQRLVWRIEEDLGEVRQSSTRPETPDNRERRNYFSTGPSFFLPLTRTDTLNLQASYARTDYDQTAESDTYRYGGTAALIHVFPSQMRMTWNNTVENVFYDDEDTEFLTKATSLGLSKREEFFDWRVEGGYSQTESQQFGGESTFDGFEGEASVAYQINSDSLLSLFASRQLTDTSSQFAVVVFDIPLTFDVQQVVQLTLYEVDYTQQITPVDTLNVSVARRYEEFQRTLESEESDGLGIRWNRRFTQTLSGFAYGNVNYRRFTELDREDYEFDMGVGVEARAYKNLSLNAWIGFSQHNSDDRQYDYNETRYGITVNYYPSFDRSATP